MQPRFKLRFLNVFFITAFLALVLACGCDPEDPPPGSLQEKLCGRWVSDPIPLIDGDRVDGTTTIEIEMSYWSVGLIASYPDELGLRTRESVALHKTRYSASGFTIAGAIAKSDSKRSGDDSTWVFRVDAAQPDVMYATWTLKHGAKRLDGVRFRKERK